MDKSPNQILSDEQNAERKEINDRHNKEWTDFNSKWTEKWNEYYKLNQSEYQPKKKRNVILGALIGAILTAVAGYYQFSSPEFEEKCEMQRTETWPIETCILSKSSGGSEGLLIYNPGALGNGSFGAAKKTIGAKEHEKLLKALGDKTPTIKTFTLYPNKEERESSDLDQEKYGSLVVYSQDKRDAVISHMSALLESNCQGDCMWTLAGTSRGGWNALQEYRWLIHAGKKLPSKILLISPMLIEWNPVSENPPVKQLEWWRIVLAVTTQNWLLLANYDFFSQGTDQLLSDAYVTKEAWKEANPLEWTVDILSRFPPTMIIGSTGDKFPFLVAGRKFAQKLKDVGVEIEYIEVPGEHATFAVKEMTEWLLH